MYNTLSWRHSDAHKDALRDCMEDDAPPNDDAPHVAVEIPAHPHHEGHYRVVVTLAWVCPKCGGPRGEVYRTHSFDGSRRMNVDGWQNPCGHVDAYRDVVTEAKSNGLN